MFAHFGILGNGLAESYADTFYTSTTVLGAAAFSSYSLSLIRMWRFGEAQVYSQLALKLDEKVSCPETKGKHYLALGLGPAFISMQIGQAFELMEKAKLACLQTGDVEVCKDLANTICM